MTNFRVDFDETVKWLFPDREVKTSEAIGTSVSSPAKDCISIRKAYPHKISGYYWVNPDCTSVPLRVFCDFKVGKGQMYAYLGPLKDDQNLPEIKNLKDVQYECAKIGLEPIEIKQESQIATISSYIEDMEINLKSGAIIPLGFDYGCSVAGCHNRFHSFNSEKSKDFTSEFDKHLDKNNLMNMKFSKGLYTQRNGIGFSTNNALQYFALGITPIKG